jgi:hypothetical protein
VSDSEKTAGKQRDRPFPKGLSGNPASKPNRARHKATQAVEALLEGEALTRKAVEMALGGDTVAMRRNPACPQSRSVGSRLSARYPQTYPQAISLVEAEQSWTIKEQVMNINQGSLMSTHSPTVEQVVRSYLDGAEGDAEAALRQVVADALADFTEMERRSAQKDRLISRGYVRSGPHRPAHSRGA